MTKNNDILKHSAVKELFKIKINKTTKQTIKNIKACGKKKK